ncbi:MAG: AAA family ATPase [Planctomycetes bacterium]|nr:AAA family ATPase [Planctomycetota bacterium]
MNDQKPVVELLMDPAAYPHAADRFETRETHISRVFLAGPYAYKLKKALNLGFLDYSTLELRRRLCEEEIRLNRRLAPRLYLDVVSVREEGGRLYLALAGETAGREVEPLVRMARVEPEALLDSLVAKGLATEEHIDRLLDLLVPFYRDAPRASEAGPLGTPEALRQTLRENFLLARRFVGDLVAPSLYHTTRSGLLTFLTLREDLFRERLRGGWVRDCHGDLRAEHVAFLPECAVLDAIEFNERLRVIDVAADLAFLKMDLDFLQAPRLARRLIDRYAALAADEGIHEMLPFYVSYRAFVRGKVAGLKMAQRGRTFREREWLHARAKRHFDLAYFHALSFQRPLLIVVEGLSGTGKSTLAKLLADRLGAPLLRSDDVRKEIAGVPHEERESTVLPPECYSELFTRYTYDEMAAKARRLLVKGATVIFDATFPRKELREKARKLARACGARLVQLECRVAPEEAARRMTLRAARGADVSDATAAIQPAQAAAYEPPEPGEAVPLETSAPPEEVLGAALAVLRGSR